MGYPIYEIKFFGNFGYLFVNYIMKKIIRLTESDLVRLVKRVLSEGDESSCLLRAKFTRESIGGPKTRRLVYEKTDNGVT